MIVVGGFSAQLLVHIGGLRYVIEERRERERLTFTLGFRSLLRSSSGLQRSFFYCIFGRKTMAARKR